MDQTEKERALWLNCAVSSEPLHGKHIVCDRLGNLFDKCSVVKAIVEKTLPSTYSHIHSLRDLINVTFSENSEFDANAESQTGTRIGSTFKSPFVCKMTGLHVNGIHRFSVLIPCGHVFATKGLKTSVHGDKEMNCYICQNKYTKEDILELNPGEDVKNILIEKLNEVRKIKKRKANPNEGSDSQIVKKKKKLKKELPKSKITPTNKQKVV